MVKKKGNKFGYTRQYHISLSYQQIDLYKKAIKTQNELYQFALRYLYKTYGRKHIGRLLPFGQGINYLNNKIKAMFIKEKLVKIVFKNSSAACEDNPSFLTFQRFKSYFSLINIALILLLR